MLRRYSMQLYMYFVEQPKFTPQITPLSEIANLGEDVVYVTVMGVISDAEDPYYYLQGAFMGLQYYRRFMDWVN